MNHRVLIDTNVFLRFYDTKDGSFKTLLEFIQAISSELFISQLVKNEIQRNKISVAIASFRNLEQNLKIKGSDLPPQFSDPTSKLWNETISKIKDLQESQKKIFSGLLKAISEGKDNVSIALDSILSKAIPHSDKEFNEAEKRKKLGMPPGKKSDPIGDELTWIQFINTVETDSKVIIVSYDTDYIETYNNQAYLNPILIDDIISRGVSRENIFPFHKLIEFYKTFRSEFPSIQVIPEKISDEISKEEEVPKYNLSQYSDYTGLPGGYGTSASPGTTRNTYSFIDGPLVTFNPEL